MIADAAPAARQEPTGARQAAGLLALGVVAYALALVVTLPAKVALGWAGVAGAQDATGTIWSGSAPMGLTQATWRTAPLRSLGQFALSADLAISGTDTRIDGRASWRPGRLVLEDMTGKAGWPLLAALAPKLPFVCDLGFDVAMRRIVVAGPRSGAVGDLTSAGGSCRAAGATTQGPPVPPLVGQATMDAGGAGAWIAPAARRLDRLVDATVTHEGRLAVAIHPTATALLPAGAGIGAVTIETQL